LFSPTFEFYNNSYLKNISLRETEALTWFYRDMNVKEKKERRGNETLI